MGITTCTKCHTSGNFIVCPKCGARGCDIAYDEFYEREEQVKSKVTVEPDRGTEETD